MVQAAAFDDGDFSGATAHDGNGENVVAPIITQSLEQPTLLSLTFQHVDQLRTQITSL